MYLLGVFCDPTIRELPCSIQCCDDVEEVVWVAFLYRGRVETLRLCRPHAGRALEQAADLRSDGAIGRCRRQL